MKIADVAKLRGIAEPHTHLVRFDKASDTGAKHVLDVVCPYCGALRDTQCRKKGEL